MSIQKRDYILRMIEQIAETLASIVGLKNAGKLDEAEQLVRETSDGLLGPLKATLPGLDAASVASLLGSREKLAAYAALVREEGSILEKRGDAESIKRARRARRRALELYREVARSAESATSARAERTPVDEAALEAIRALEDELAAPRA